MLHCPHQAPRPSVRAPQGGWGKGCVCKKCNLTRAREGVSGRWELFGWWVRPRFSSCQGWARHALATGEHSTSLHVHWGSSGPAFDAATKHPVL